MNLSRFILTSLLFFGFFNSRVQAQAPTVGLTYFNANVAEGYFLFTPELNHNVYLVNNCGEVINKWTFNEEPGATCYLLENGDLLRSGKDSLQIRSWDNSTLWSYATTANGIAQHHDIEPLPNGNILCVSTDIYSNAEIIAEGRDPGLGTGNLKLDRIVELSPTGVSGATIVWEWKFKEHLIQDFDNSKANYGVVENSPELLDINFDNGEDFDYTHLNSIDYNASLDQIIISARNLSEIYIIDHSTTTIEAATHSGGASNRGGDFLWRWGNQQLYRQGTNLDQQLFGQHDAKWINQGYLDEGKISVFNNGGDGSYNFSSIDLINPEIINGNYTMASNTFLPSNKEWTWNGSIQGNVLRQTKKGGLQAQANGNFLVCETSTGHFFEITKAGDHVWSYVNPTTTTTSILSQFDIPAGFNLAFRVERYPLNYIGFNGQDLSSQGIIENQNSLSEGCILAAPTVLTSLITVINPIVNKKLMFSKTMSSVTISLLDLSGKLLLQELNFIGSEISVDFPSGMYFLNISYNGESSIQKIIIQ